MVSDSSTMECMAGVFYSAVPSPCGRDEALDPRMQDTSCRGVGLLVSYARCTGGTRGCRECGRQVREG